MAITIGVTFGHYTATPYGSGSGPLEESFEEDWWPRMREHIKARWEGIEDETRYDEMIQHMKEQWNEIQSQDWFNEMLEYMEEHGCYHHGYRQYEEYHPGFISRNQRGYGCRGW